MNIAILLGLLAACAGSVCIYLASGNQRWRAQPLPATPARIAGCTLLVLAWLAFARAMQIVTASFVWPTLLMLVWAALPYIGALQHPKPQEVKDER